MTELLITVAASVVIATIVNVRWIWRAAYRQGYNAGWDAHAEIWQVNTEYVTQAEVREIFSKPVTFPKGNNPSLPPSHRKPPHYDQPPPDDAA